MGNRTTIIWAAAFGMTAVILGALAAHALRAELQPQSLESFQTAVRYQMWHALALLALGLSSLNLKYRKAIVVFWIAGTFLFCGSIFILSTSQLHAVEVSFLGPVTPLGGLAFIGGWFMLLLSALRKAPPRV